MLTEPDQFQRAAALHEQGKLAEAKAAYQEILARDPRHAETLHHLGILALQEHQPDEAVRLIARALTVTPDNIQALNDHGSALAQMNRGGEALASFNRALSIKPDFDQSLLNRGNVFLQLGQLEQALADYDRLLALRPDFAEILYIRGNVLLQLGRLDEAVSSYDRALAIKPDLLETWANRGTVLQALQRFEDAVISFDRALALDPWMPDLHFNKGNALFDLGRRDEALASYDQALVFRPDYAEALCCRGNVLLDLHRMEEALASHDRALALKPDFAQAWCNRGNVLREMKRLDEAIVSYDRGLTLNPEYPEAHSSFANCLLFSGDFLRGWKEAEWRWRHEPMINEVRDFREPLWLGDSDIAGRTLLIHAEQGFGDTLQFCRYVSMVAKRGATVVLEVQPELKSLLASVAGYSHLIARGEPIPSFDVQCPMMSLPLALKTTLSTIPADIPYLSIPSELEMRWVSRLGERTRPRVGLVWRGAARHKNDRHRSIDPTLLTPLLKCDVDVFSLQKDLREADRNWLAAHPEVRDCSPDLRDFSETAALASLMDVVITADTSVAHLAGALGLPVWIMLSRLGLDYRWLLDRSDTPWYPAARLYRQSAAGAWQDVITRIAEDVREFVNS